MDSLKLTVNSQSIEWDRFDAVVLVLSPEHTLDESLGSIPSSLLSEIKFFTKRREFKKKPGQTLSFESATGRTVVLAVTPKQRQRFYWLEWGRKTMKAVKEGSGRSLLLSLNHREIDFLAATDALVSSVATAWFEGPDYKQPSPKEKKKSGPPEIRIACPSPEEDAVKSQATRSDNLAQGTNLVRSLCRMAGNDLTTTRYVRLAMETARARGLDSDFFGLPKLKTMKAGAFLAVAQGSADQGGGILKLSYEPKGKTTQRLVLVGKGITFDTGGSNLKTGSHMFGMHEDMAGSAVAMAVALLAAREKWPVEVHAFLAITDNVLSRHSYRPNDVVTSLKGKTIEVVDTDAEGRMVLADTLHLASREKPTLLIDFATLTGACIRAIGTHYSGAYTNRSKLYSVIRKAGRKSGERVWPFPNDSDYGRCLKSEIADIKQCRLSGGSDHIEAGYFLSQFVDKGIPWVHVDLSAISNEGGLAHVPGKSTGFGVRFAVSLAELVLGAFPTTPAPSSH